MAEPLTGDPGERRRALLHGLLTPSQRYLYQHSAHFKTTVDFLIDHMLPGMVAGLEQEARTYDDDYRRAMERAMIQPPEPMVLPLQPMGFVDLDRRMRDRDERG